MLQQGRVKKRNFWNLPHRQAKEENKAEKQAPAKEFICYSTASPAAKESAAEKNMFRRNALKELGERKNKQKRRCNAKPSMVSSNCVTRVKVALKNYLLPALEKWSSASVC